MKRSDLHAAVWKDPSVHVAQRIGISDSRLTTICQQADIPKPPRGYWRQFKTGQAPARVPLPRPDQDYDVPLREVAGAGVEAAAGDAEPTAAPAPGDGANAVSPLPLPAQVEPSPPKVVKAPVKLKGAASQDQPARDLDPVAVYVALDAECERAMSSGMDYQRQLAAESFLAALVSQAPKLDVSTAQAMLAWARAVGQRLDRKDPVAAVIQSIRQASEGQQKPLWWPQD